jgi:hypothetical protein
VRPVPLLLYPFKNEVDLLKDSRLVKWQCLNLHLA